MINLIQLETQPFDMATIYIRDSQPIHLDTNSIARVVGEEVHITRDNVLIQTSKDDPGKHAKVVEIIDAKEITGLIFVKYNLIDTVPPGLILTKRGEA